jgi:hypothetical protein
MTASRTHIAAGGYLMAAALAVWACTPAQTVKLDTALATPAGALFCKFQTQGGGSLVVSLVNAAILAKAGASAPAAVMATGMTKQSVDDACARAAPGAVPVPPPADPAAAPKVVVAVPVA